MYAFVLKRADFRENDQIITLYTNEKGKIEVLARGVKKILSKNTAYLEPYFLLEAEVVPGKDKFYLIKVVPMTCYKNIVGDLNKMTILQIGLRWADSLLSAGERERKIFFLIKNWLEYLDEKKDINPNLIFAFLGRLLAKLGFLPELNKCIFCNSKNDLVWFSPSGGGVVCKHCVLLKKTNNEKIYPIRPVDVQILKIIFIGRWDRIAKVNTAVANNLVFLFAQYHSERKLAKFKLFC